MCDTIRVPAGLRVPLLALAMAAMPLGSAWSLDQVSLAFSFTGSAAVTGLIATEAEGYFKAANVNVTFVTPGNAADSVKLLASNQVQFALVNSPEILLARSRDVPIRSIYAGIQYGTAGIMAPVEANVRTLKDLEGKTVGVTGLPANKAMYLQVLRANGVDLDKVRTINIGFGTIPALVGGLVNVLGDAISYAEPINYNKARGKPVDDTSTITYFPFYKYGGPQYYVYNIAARDDYLAQNPAVVRRFLDGLSKGMAWAVANPEAAVKRYLAVHSEFDPASATATWKSVAALVTSPDTAAHGLGWQNEKVWGEISQFMYDSKATPAKVDPAAVFTNDYLNHP